MFRQREAWPRPGVLAVCTGAYGLAAVLFTWPLVLHFSTKLTGLPGSDLGVYLWNLWVFRHEVVAGHSPLHTSSILSLDTPVDLSLHNYTIFSDLLAVPLLPVMGLVTSHNFLMLLNLVAGAVTMFLLVHHVVRRPWIAWLAGLLFGFSPMMIARAEIHPSLSAAAPLPLFVLILFKLHATRAVRWAVAGGVTLAWAAYCDPYYAVYCALLGGWFLWTRAVKVRSLPWRWHSPHRSVHVLDGIIAGILAVVAAVLVTGGVKFAAGSVRVSLTTVYTPNLLLAVAVVARIWLTTRPRVRLRPLGRWVPLVPLMACLASVSAVLLSPILYALTVRWLEGRGVSTPLFWRTSTPGADLVTLFLPNPNHVWLGAPWRHWLEGQAGGYAENITSITVVAAVTILFAVWRAGFRIPRFWGWLAVVTGALTLGPFLRVAGIDTLIPAPWAVLRYVPVLGAARSPARFAVLLMLAVAVLFALALRALADRYPSARRPVLALAGLLLVAELCPAPRLLHDGTIPAIYARIASDPRDVRVLELPFGVRDGLSSFGNFSAASQFHQTLHGKRLMGGYLSRVSSRRVEGVKRRPVLALLMALSEGREVSQADIDAASARAPAFVRAVNLGYVVMDRTRTSPALVDAAITVLRLQRIGVSGTRELYRPGTADLVADGGSTRAGHR